MQLRFGDITGLKNWILMVYWHEERRPNATTIIVNFSPKCPVMKRKRGTSILSMDILKSKTFRKEKMVLVRFGKHVQVEKKKEKLKPIF